MAIAFQEYLQRRSLFKSVYDGDRLSLILLRTIPA